MLEDIKKDATDRMGKCVNAFRQELKRLRTGRASASLVDHIRVDYYGAESPLNQVANVAVEDARTITIVPYDKQMVGTIGRSAAGIDFAALDHAPVYSIVLLLSPENAPQQHLQAMNAVFNNLQKDTFRRFLRQSSTREAIAELLDEADQGK